MYAIICTDDINYVGVDQAMAENLCFWLRQQGIRILGVRRYKDADND